MFGMCKTKHNSKDCNRCLFIVNKIDILWSSLRTASSLIINFEQVIQPFLVLNIYFIFFYLWLIALFTRVLLRVTVYYYHVTYTFQRESALYSFRTSCSKQVQYLNFKWTVTPWKYSRSDIAQTSSLCCVAGF